MSSKKILIIEDEEDIVELMRHNLVKQGHQVTYTYAGEKGVEMVGKERPDLILLDLMLPGLDGIEICKILKGNPDTAAIPIIMVSAKGEETDIIQGLELGADDYITKPFGPRVLLARVEAVLRRYSEKTEVSDENANITLYGLAMNPRRHEAHYQGEKLDLSLTEFRILHFLVQHPGWVFTRSQIVNGIRGPNYPVTDRAVDVQIVGLRKKLKEAGPLIQTVRGVGYRFENDGALDVGPVSQAPSPTQPSMNI